MNHQLIAARRRSARHAPADTNLNANSISPSLQCSRVGSNWIVEFSGNKVSPARLRDGYPQDSSVYQRCAILDHDLRRGTPKQLAMRLSVSSFDQTFVRLMTAGRRPVFSCIQEAVARAVVYLHSRGMSARCRLPTIPADPFLDRTR